LFRITAIAALLVVATGSIAQADLVETTAKRVHIVDADSGLVLLSRGADEPFPPGSFAKLMTAEIVFHALEEGRLSPDTEFQVSEHAWRMGGAPSRTATMFAKLKSSVPVADLLQGLTVQMANDAAIVLAEGMKGSEEAFAQAMNERAKELGLKNTHFVNPTGLPAQGHHVTARDMTALAMHLWRAYPERYALFSQPAFEWNRIFQRNKNPLINLNIGADGLMTGFAEGYGFSVVASASNGERRVFATIAGLETEAERVEEARKLLQWALDGFTKRQMFAAHQKVGEADVYGGEKKTVGLRVGDAVSVLAPVDNPSALHVRIVYQRPLPAPIREGDVVGELQVWVGDTLSSRADLYAAETVEYGTLSQRAFGAVAELLVGWLRQLSWDCVEAKMKAVAKTPS